MFKIIAIFALALLSGCASRLDGFSSFDDVVKSYGGENFRSIYNTTTKGKFLDPNFIFMRKLLLGKKYCEARGGSVAKISDDIDAIQSELDEDFSGAFGVFRCQKADGYYWDFSYKLLSVSGNEYVKNVLYRAAVQPGK